MPEQLLTVLKLCLLALLYLFFLRVLRAVWTEVDATQGRGGRRACPRRHRDRHRPDQDPFGAEPSEAGGPHPPGGGGASGPGRCGVRVWDRS